MRSPWVLATLVLCLGFLEQKVGASSSLNAPVSRFNLTFVLAEQSSCPISASDLNFVWTYSGETPLHSPSSCLQLYSTRGTIEYIIVTCLGGENWTATTSEYQGCINSDSFSNTNQCKLINAAVAQLQVNCVDSVPPTDTPSTILPTTPVAPNSINDSSSTDISPALVIGLSFAAAAAVVSAIGTGVFLVRRKRAREMQQQQQQQRRLNNDEKNTTNIAGPLNHQRSNCGNSGVLDPMLHASAPPYQSSFSIPPPTYIQSVATQPQFCGKCGAPTGADKFTRFCGKCGASV